MKKLYYAEFDNEMLVINSFRIDATGNGYYRLQGFIFNTPKDDKRYAETKEKAVTELRKVLKAKQNKLRAEISKITEKLEIIDANLAVTKC